MSDVFFDKPLRRFFFHRPIVREWFGSTAQMDWVETPISHILKMNVPGYGKDDIKVELEEGNVLIIRGEGAKEESYPKDAIFRISEREKGDFSRGLQLPDNVKTEQIKAHVDNGVLTVIVPKAVSPKSKSKNIAISGKL